MPPQVVDHLRSDRIPDLTFRPDSHLYWASDDASLVVAGWTSDDAVPGDGRPWHVTAQRDLTAVSGATWLDAEPWAEGRPWCAQLAERVTAEVVDDLASRLDGVFALVVARADGRAAITTDPLGLRPLYRASNRDVTVWSDRAALAARLVTPPGGTPPRDVAGAVLLAHATYLQRQATTWTGVEVLSPATVVHLTPDGRSTERCWSPRPWIDDDLASLDAGELVERAVGRLRDLVRAQATAPASAHVLELTGGRDSRAILALLLAEGLAQDFIHITWGSADLADVRVAGELADRYGLDLRAEGHRRSRPARDPGYRPSLPSREALPPLSYDESIRRHVWRTSGAVSVAELTRADRRTSGISAMTGVGGEALRTNYPSTTGMSHRALAAYVRRGGFHHDGAGLLRRDTRRRLDDAVVADLDDLRQPGTTTEDVVDAFYLTARLRRWFGPMNEVETRHRVLPLYGLVPLRVAFALGSEARRRELLPFEVMRRSDPELPKVDFASGGWPAALVSHLPDAGEYPVADLRAARLRRTALTAWQWRWVRNLSQAVAPRKPPVVNAEVIATDLEARIPVLLRYADLGPDHALYEHLDHDRTIHAIRTLPAQPFGARRAVHAAVTAAMWLGGAETPDPRD